MHANILSLPRDILTYLHTKYLRDGSIPLLQLVCKRMKQLTNVRMAQLTTSLPSCIEVLRFVQVMYETDTNLDVAWYLQPFPSLTNQLFDRLLHLRVDATRMVTLAQLYLEDREAFSIVRTAKMDIIDRDLYGQLILAIAGNMLVDPHTMQKTLLYRRRRLSDEMRRLYVELVNNYYNNLLSPLLDRVIKPTIIPLQFYFDVRYDDWIRNCLVTLPQDSSAATRVEYKQIRNIITFLIRGWLCAESFKLGYLVSSTNYMLRTEPDHLAADITSALKIGKNYNEFFAEFKPCIPSTRMILHWLTKRLRNDTLTRLAMYLEWKALHIVVEIEIVNKIALYRCYCLPKTGEIEEITMIGVPSSCTIEEMLRTRNIPGLIDPITLLKVAEECKISPNKQLIDVCYHSLFNSHYKLLFDVSSMDNIEIEEDKHGNITKIFQPSTTLNLPKLLSIQFIRFLTLCWLNKSDSKLRLSPIDARIGSEQLLMQICPLIWRSYKQTHKEVERLIVELILH